MLTILAFAVQFDELLDLKLKILKGELVSRADIAQQVINLQKVGPVQVHPLHTLANLHKLLRIELVLY